MDKVVYFFSLPWNFLMLKLAGAQYIDFPTIIGFIRIKAGKGKLIIGKRLLINSSRWVNPVGLSSCTYLCVNKNAVLAIGNNVGISNSLIFANYSVIIEDDVMIGGGCQILDNDFHSMNYNIRRSVLDQDHVCSKEVIIRKGAFIGTQSIILKGVEIGEQSIIAAGSVVSKSIPAFEVWGGNPARYIKKIKID